MALLNERSQRTTRQPLNAPATPDPASPTPQAPVTTARTLGDWLSDPSLLRPPAAILPHLVVSGRVTLLSGREKIGKSTLVASAAAAASLGGPVLGVAIDRPLHTLWYSIDEPIGDTARRFATLGADVGRLAINKEPRTESELLGAIDVDLATFAGVDLVVVDTLSRVLSASGVDPNSSREVEPLMGRLVDCFHRHSVAAILNYHTGKGGREYRGSTAIGATVDDILTLRRRGASEEDDFEDDAADDGRRLLVQDGRNLRGRVHLTCSNGVYSPFEETARPRTRLLETLRDHGTARNRGELVKLAGVRKTVGLRTVADLIAGGSIRETRGQLKPTPAGVAELGSHSIGVSSSSSSREPLADAQRFPGSARFPEEGTGQEPMPELSLDVSDAPGSRSAHPLPAEAGTAISARRPMAHVQL